MSNISATGGKDPFKEGGKRLLLATLIVGAAVGIFFWWATSTGNFHF